MLDASLHELVLDFIQQQRENNRHEGAQDDLSHRNRDGIDENLLAVRHLEHEYKVVHAYPGDFAIPLAGM